MKKFAFVLLGLFLAAMAVTAAVSALRHHGDWIEFIIAFGFTCGAGRSFQAARRIPSTRPPRTPTPDSRPWER